MSAYIVAEKCSVKKVLPLSLGLPVTHIDSSEHASYHVLPRGGDLP
jgi:hypothetical protein